MEVNMQKERRKAYKALVSTNPEQNSTMRTLLEVEAIAKAFGVTVDDKFAQAADSTRVEWDELKEYAHPDQVMRYMISFGPESGEDLGAHMVGSIVEQFRDALRSNAPIDPINVVRYIAPKLSPADVVMKLIENDPALLATVNNKIKEMFNKAVNAERSGIDEL